MLSSNNLPGILLHHLARQAHALVSDTLSSIIFCLCAFFPALSNGDDDSAYQIGFWGELIAITQ